jgi:hypothetical protein
MKEIEKIKREKKRKEEISFKREIYPGLAQRPHWAEQSGSLQ